MKMIFTSPPFTSAVRRPHEGRAFDDVPVNLFLDDRDDLSFPMMVKIALAYKLRDVSLVDVIPVQAVRGAAPKVSPSL